MRKIKCSEVMKAIDGVLLSGSADAEFIGISTDSRKILGGELFLPIVGEKFDGHTFIRDTLAAGAAGAITHQKPTGDMDVKDKVLILTDDTMKALRKLATWYRNEFRIPFVGITGSVGKTSTKDMVAAILEEKYRVLKTQGNFNNEIGVPLTIFNLDGNHEVGVVEMGMSGFGEIRRLTSIVKPQIAILTNIGLSHIEKLGSRENILRAKLEILEGLDPNGLVIINGDDGLLSGTRGLLKFRTIYYGMEEENDLRAYNIMSSGERGTYFDIMIQGKEYRVHVPVPGLHHVLNALAAIAAGLELKVPMERIISGIAHFSLGNMRQNIMVHNGCKIINDAYNASPNSMEAAINVLRDIRGSGRTMAILGDMLEMGDWAQGAHNEVGRFAFSAGIDYIITVGDLARNIAKGAKEAGMSPNRVYSFDTNEVAAQFLKKMIGQGDVILVKGSRGMKMEEIVNLLLQE